MRSIHTNIKSIHLSNILFTSSIHWVVQHTQAIQTSKYPVLCGKAIHNPNNFTNKDKNILLVELFVWLRFTQTIFKYHYSHKLEKHIEYFRERANVKMQIILITVLTYKKQHFSKKKKKLK